MSSDNFYEKRDKPVAFINHRACMAPTLDYVATAGTLWSEPLYAHPSPQEKKEPTMGPCSDDTARLDYLQRSGATVDIIMSGADDFHPFRFRIGGLNVAISIDLRDAIDASMRATGEIA